MARWWNRSSQWDGLFDFQNRVRPSYYAFKLLSRLTGERLRLESPDAAVHGFATWDPKLLVYNILLWNYTTAPAQVDLTVERAPSDLTLRQVVLDAAAASDDENVRLKPAPARDLSQAGMRIRVDLGSYGTFEAPAEGNLYLRCKDRWNELADNKGAITVKLKLAGRGNSLERPKSKSTGAGEAKASTASESSSDDAPALKPAGKPRPKPALPAPSD